MTDDDTNVVKLSFVAGGVEAKGWEGFCDHRFIVDLETREVECGKCMREFTAYDAMEYLAQNSSVSKATRNEETLRRSRSALSDLKVEEKKAKARLSRARRGMSTTERGVADALIQALHEAAINIARLVPDDRVNKMRPLVAKVRQLFEKWKATDD